MAITNLYLYGALDANVADSYKAKEFLDKEGVEYTNLFYSDESQLKNVLTPVNSWFPDRANITAFPFLVWDENGTRYVAAGLKEIKLVNFKEVPAPTK